MNMAKFVVGDRVGIKVFVSDTRPRFKMSGTIVSAYGRWFTVKHDDIDLEEVKRSRGSYESHVGPRFDYQEDELIFESPLLRLVDDVYAAPEPKSKITSAVENIEKVYGHLHRTKRRKAS
jgi:hypothetical protein